MKLFYYCYGRAHSSVITGWIHLNHLPMDRVPTVNEIISMPGFDQSDADDFGTPCFLGKDEFDNEVFIIGFGGESGLGLQTIYFINNWLGNPIEWKFINALATVGWLTKIGGFISKKLNWPHLGKYLAALGIQRSYSNLAQLVKSVKGD